MRKEEKRTVAGFIYISIGAICFYMIFMTRIVGVLCFIYKDYFAWVFGWAFVGTGVGLINTRKNGQVHPLHLIGYCLFVTVITACFSFLVGLTMSKISSLSDLSIVYNMEMHILKYYLVTALVSLLAGCFGPNFLKIINKVMNGNRNLF